VESIVCKLRRSKSPKRIDIGVSWKEIEEARIEMENINISESIVHVQDVIADSCLEFQPDEAGSGRARRDQARLGVARQGEDSKTNLKEVGAKTEDYFKRVNVFSCGQARYHQTRRGGI